MNTPENNTLHNAAGLLDRGCSDARSWVRDVAPSASVVGQQKRTLIDHAMRAQNISRKVLGAALRSPCVGVFGPSQAGKSFLVSVLARPTDGKPLKADFGGTEKNFFTEINPPGDRESTGLVTRFTIRREPVKSSHPVEVRLLSETDLVKIMGNTFFSDFDPNLRSKNVQPPTEETIRARIAELRPLAGQPREHLDEIDMFDIGEYFDHYFKVPTEAFRNAEYWAALREFGHQLNFEQRVKLYSLLWGEMPDLTKLFRGLLENLETLGHAQKAYAHLDAIEPRTRCIIDVQILYELGTPECAADTISVTPSRGGRDGGVVKVPRAVLTALVAEIKIVMPVIPSNFFNNADLLDFPGARSREKMLDLSKDIVERDKQVIDMLLRGKIAYLFQRFTDDRELTSMLLCMPDSNMEVKDLPAMVREWVEVAHGSSPEERAKTKCALFLVLTKFDRTFQETSGDTKDSRATKLDRRLEASFTKPFGGDDWVKDWDGQGPFKNSFFLRNPAVRQGDLIEYRSSSTEQQDDGSGVPEELGIAESANDRLEVYRTGFVNSTTCKLHFNNPVAAWEAAFKPNDGGIKYLVEGLENVLDPQLKENQLVARLLGQAAQVKGKFAPLFYSGSAESRIEKEKALKKLCSDLFKATANGKHIARFVRMLSECLVYNHEVREAFLNVASLKLDQTPVVTEGGPAELEDPWAEAPAAAQSVAPSSIKAPNDKFSLFASKVLSLWIAKVSRLGTDSRVVSRLAIDSRLLGEIANELIKGAHRNGLEDAIAKTIRTQLQAAQLVWEKAADRASGIAVHLVDDYVTYFGFARLLEKERPSVKGRPVFKVEPLPDGVPVLEAAPKTLDIDFFTDWGTGFVKLGLDNLDSKDGREISEEDNVRLGQIIGLLSVNPVLGRVLS